MKRFRYITLVTVWLLAVAMTVRVNAASVGDRNRMDGQVCHSVGCADLKCSVNVDSLSVSIKGSENLRSVALGTAVSGTPLPSGTPAGDTSMSIEVDSLAIERTQRFYDSLASHSSRSKFWKFVHDLVVLPRRSPVSNQVVDETAIYGKFNGKIIDSIAFYRKPVFEPARSYLEKGANAVHANTAYVILKRDLLFQVGDEFDATTVVKFKQLLRSRSYIADSDIEVIPVEGNPDAVIVNVITQDSWSISADGSVKGFTGEVWGELYDANFLGSGDKFAYRLSIDWRRKAYQGSMFKYYSPNLFGAFYEADFTAGRSFNERIYGGNISKKLIFASDYAVGVIAERVRHPVYVRYDLNDMRVDASYVVNYNHLDLWGGKSWFAPALHNSIYVLGRGERLHYLTTPVLLSPEETPDSPPEISTDVDLNPYFHSRTMALASFGIYNEHFLTANLIYGYGYDEYIATGLRAEAVVGYAVSDYRNGLYTGLGFKAGGFTSYGYFMGDVAVGSFFDLATHAPFHSALKIKFDYFTNILGRGKFKLRQFVSLNYLNGWNRSEGFREAIWFTRESGPRDMQRSPIGSDRLVVSSESVVFTPWQPLGFRIALYGFADVGFLGFNKNVFLNGCYATIGLGVRMKNEMLVFGTLQFNLFVSFGRGGLMSNEWIQLTSERRIQVERYIPSKPEIVQFQ